MPYTLYDSAGESGKKSEKTLTSIVVGKVVNNRDCVGQGKVLVRIPSLDQEVWARMASLGGGSKAGFFYVPRKEDEVLVALRGNEPEDAFILGGLWTTKEAPPEKNPVTSPQKRVIHTGITAGHGHKVEFDEGPAQSITITSATDQKIMLDKEKIEIETTGGKVKISLDFTSIKIEAVANIEISTKGSLKLSAGTIDIDSKGPMTVKGKPISLN